MKQAREKISTGIYLTMVARSIKTISKNKARETPG
jgi:hypothetical protein